MTKQATRRRRQVRAANSITRPSGLGSEHDFGSMQAPLFQFMTPWMQDKFAVQLYHTDWQARKIVSIPVQDVLRESWTYDGLSEQHKADMAAAAEKLKVLEALKQAGRLERLVGGAVVFLGVADGTNDPSKPLNLAGIQKGALRFLNVIPRSSLAPRDYDTDPLSPTYGRPSVYTVRGGQHVHRSRFIIFDGDPLLSTDDALMSSVSFIRRDGFGTSVLLPIYDELMRATGTRQGAYHLVQRASVIIAQMDTMDLAGTKEGEKAVSAMADIVNQINMFRGAVIDRQPGDGDTVSTMAASFGSVPELVLSFVQILSAASDIPATRFLGQAPGGLNATGESDLENYYGRLESEQRVTWSPRAMQLAEVLGRSVFGPQFEAANELAIEFPPLWSLSEVEQAGIRTQDVANVVSLVGAGLLDDDAALRELEQRDALLIDAATITPPEPEPEADPVADPAQALDKLNAALSGQPPAA